MNIQLHPVGWDIYTHYTGRNWIAIRIRYRQRYVGEKMIKLHRRWAPPKLLGVQTWCYALYTPALRQQYASVPCTPPIRRRHSFECFFFLIVHLIIYKALDIQYTLKQYLLLFRLCSNTVVFTLISSLSTCVGRSFSSHPQRESH